MKQYNVTGMSCAACVNRVESAVLKVPGVSKCSVSLLTNSMGVEGEAGDKEIIEAVKKAGYGASAKEGNISDGLKNVSGAEVDLEDKETPVLIKRLVVSAILVLVLMYFSMGHPMLGFPVPKLIDENMVALGLLELILAAAVMVIKRYIFINCNSE